MKTGAEIVAEERIRQLTKEGWSFEHDLSGNNNEQLARAAAVYSLPLEYRDDNGYQPAHWPWDIKWYKPSPEDRIKELAKAGALIIAEIDRINLANMNITEKELIKLYKIVE